MRVCTECSQEFEDWATTMSYFICDECLIDID